MPISRANRNARVFGLGKLGECFGSVENDLNNICLTRSVGKGNVGRPNNCDNSVRCVCVKCDRLHATTDDEDALVVRFYFCFSLKFVVKMSRLNLWARSAVLLVKVLRGSRVQSLPDARRGAATALSLQRPKKVLRVWQN